MKKLMKKITPRSLLLGYYYAMEFFAAARYGFPGEKLNVIGITGTKGKSTTVYLATRILEEAGLTVASSSSIELRINGKSEPQEVHVSMPSRLHLQRFLARAKKQGCAWVALEVTSEGLAQRRADFINFRVALLTNCTPEHIESHGSYEAYKRAKRRLFEMLEKKEGIAIVNADDPEANYFLDAHKGKRIRYSLKKAEKVDTPLMGEFNQYNALAASTIAGAVGIQQSTIRKALRGVTVIPGRLEEIGEGQNFRVFVDYAYNTSALEAVLETASKLRTQNSKLIVLTGSAGGGRDRWRRPVMGEIAARYGDIVMITSEDSFGEDPNNIIQEVRAGSEKVKREGKKVEIYSMEDRRKAIKKVLQLAQNHDIVILAGMGMELSLATPQGEIPWDERKIVREDLRALLKVKPQ